ncbi:MAG: DMT family transporter [Hyphomicrobiaceae bacterium]|nr:MAG: DMT family transporter [Hyphomicrobiaceae bacterium]
MMSREWRGMLWGFVAVVSFSLTLPATRAAAPHLGMGFVAFGRAIGAGLVALLVLWLTRQQRPQRRDLIALSAIALGVVVGFPFLTTFAMFYVPAAHGAVVVGLLPLSTAIAGALVAGERPSVGFWLTSAAGTGVLLAFVLDRAEGNLHIADAALIGAVACAAIGYALGGRLALRLGGWQVISWALVVSLPVLCAMAPLLVEWPARGAPWSAWAGFVYITLVSQFIGFFAWYRGLALGGIARVSQTQLTQLFLTLGASALLLGETLEPRLLIFGAAVVVIVAFGTHLRVERKPSMQQRTGAMP